MDRLYIKKRFESQTGSGDNFALIGVFVVICLISAVLVVLGWVKESRIARDSRHFSESQPKVAPKRGPSGYQLTY